MQAGEGLSFREQRGIEQIAFSRTLPLAVQALILVAHPCNSVRSRHVEPRQGRFKTVRPAIAALELTPPVRVA